MSFSPVLCYRCATCTNTVLGSFSWSSDNAAFYVSGASDSCPMASAQYYIQHIAHLTGNYYGGMIRYGTIDIPVCFNWSPQGSLTLLLADSGACPKLQSPASCQQGWTTGTAELTILGQFTRTSMPSGSVFGKALVLPSTSQCTQCRTPLTAPFSAAWGSEGSSVTFKVSASTNGSHCKVSAHTWALQGVSTHPEKNNNSYIGFMEENNELLRVCILYNDTDFSAEFSKADGTPIVCPSGYNIPPSCDSAPLNSSLAAQVVSDPGTTDCLCSISCGNSAVSYTSYHLQKSCDECTNATCLAATNYFPSCGTSTPTVTVTCPITAAFKVLYIVLICIGGVLLLFVALPLTIRSCRRKGYTRIGGV